MHNFYTVVTGLVLSTVASWCFSYPVADALLGEKLYPAEAYYADLIERTVAKTVYPGHAIRDAHTKAHGCVAAHFRVNEWLPADLVHGVLQPGKAYPAWVRFSNGENDAARADDKGDTRGMAVKLMQVEGEKLLDIASEAKSQDFILINSPRFFINAPAKYAAFFAALQGDLWEQLKIPWYLGWQGSMNAWKMRRSTIANPLDTRYWSVVPSQLGVGDSRQAIKLSARPCHALGSLMPDDAGPDFLAKAMQDTLRKNSVCMDFMLQRRKPAMSVENVMDEWSETTSEFVSVAKLIIPAQDFLTPTRQAICENLSFNPWHALPAHKPLGAISRIRLQVYQGISERRLSMHGQVPRMTPLPPLKPL